MWYVGWIMDYGDRKETFSYIFLLFYASITIGTGVIFSYS